MKKFILSLVALISIGGAYSFANYTMTQGAGTTFGSVVVGGFHYVQMFVCDLATPAQCASVSAAGAIKVDNSAVTQPVSGTVTANIGTAGTLATAANQNTGNTSVASIDTKTPALGQALAAASVPVILPAATITTLTPPTTVTANIGTGGSLATAANQSTEISSLATIATNSALPLPAQSNFTTNIGSATLNDANSNAVLNDPCQTVAKTYTPINVVTATNTIITGVSAKKKYICGIFLYPAGTTNVAIFQATTATACVTALVGVIGGTTTATGMIMTAQAGFVLGNGSSSVAATTVNQTDLCIVTSAAIQVSGIVVTVDR